MDTELADVPTPVSTGQRRASKARLSEV